VVRVRIDKDACQSSGRCVQAAAEAFRLDADRLAEALPASSALPRERLVAIARACPALAIALYDDDGSPLDF
jgi:ferredoxin